MAELASIAQQGQAKYSPLDMRVSDWNAMQQNQRNYLEAERKNQEQRDLRDKLAALGDLKLPTNIQKDIELKRDELIEKVRNGEIDPYNYEFNAQVQGVLGYANGIANKYQEAKKLALQEGQVIDQDELGYIDRKKEYQNMVLSPELTVEQLNQAYTPLAKQTKEIPINREEIQKFVQNYDNMTADERMKLLPQGYGYLAKKTTTDMDDVEKKALKDAIAEMTKLGAMSQQAKVRGNYGDLYNGKNFEGFLDEIISPFLQTERVKEDAVTDVLAVQAAKDRAAMERQKQKTADEKSKEGFDVSRSSYTAKVEVPIDPLDPSVGMQKMPTTIIQYALAEAGVEADEVTKIEIVPKKSGEQLKNITFKGMQGKVGAIYIDDKGNGVVDFIKTKSITDKTTQKVTNKITKGSQESYIEEQPITIPVKKSDIDYLSKLYKVDLIGGGEQSAQETTPQGSYVTADGYEIEGWNELTPEQKQQLIDAKIVVKK